METRGGAELEVREAPGGKRVVSGYAAVFSVRYGVGFYDEEILPRAFHRTLKAGPNNGLPDVVFLVSHEGEPLGRTTVPQGTPGSLRLEEREKGLWMECELDSEDTHARSVARKIETGLLNQMSFAFIASEEEWQEEKTLRLLRAVSINKGDVSVVAFGANEATTVDVEARVKLSLAERERRVAMIGRSVRGYVPEAHAEPGDSAEQEAFEAFAQRHLEELRTGSVLPDETITRARRLLQARGDQDAELARRRRERRRILDTGQR